MKYAPNTRWIIYRFFDNLIPVSDRVKVRLIRGFLARHLLGLKTATGLRLGKNVDLSGFRKIKIGAGCQINDDTVLKTWGPITIGDNVTIASYTVIWTGSHVIGDEVKRAGEGYSYQVSIGSGSWIGLRCLIHKNIGNGCIVNSGAVVLKAVEDNSLVAGNPATVVRKLTTSSSPTAVVS